MAGPINLINNLVTSLTSLLLIIATIFVIIGGYYYISGGAKTENIDKAHKMIFWAAIGYGIALAAPRIATWISGAGQV